MIEVGNPSQRLKENEVRNFHEAVQCFRAQINLMLQNTLDPLTPDARKRLQGMSVKARDAADIYERHLILAIDRTVADLKATRDATLCAMAEALDNFDYSSLVL